MPQTYADYTFYSDEYRGRMEQAAFDRLNLGASAEIDRLTHGRARTEGKQHTEQVKLACCAVADAIQINEDGGGTASESNDGVMVSYMAGMSKAKTDDERIFNAAARYLLHTGLLYRG